MHQALSVTRAQAKVVIPLVRAFQVQLGEADLVALCREAARLDEAVAVYLLPYLSFRTAKQQLPSLSMFAPAWQRLTDADLRADLAAALDRWWDARARRDRREARLSMLLVAGFLRLAGAPEGAALWQPGADGLAESDFRLAVTTVLA